MPLSIGSIDVNTRGLVSVQVLVLVSLLVLV